MLTRRPLLLVALLATTTGCYHQYLRVTGSDPVAEPERKTVYSYA